MSLIARFAVARSAGVGAALRTWSSRSRTWRHHRTKSPADNGVTGARRVGRGQRRGQVAGGGPAVDGGDEPVVGLAARRRSGAAARRRAARSTACGSGSARGAACRSARRRRRARRARRRATRRAPTTPPPPARRLQSLPGAAAQALGDQQVALAVDPGQQSTVVGDLGVAVVAVDEPALGQQHDDSIEGAGQRVGRGGDLLLDLCVVPLDPQVALGEPDLGFAVRQVWAGWRRICSRSPASSGSTSRSFGGPLRLALGRRDVQSGGGRPQRRREVAPHPRIAGVRRAWAAPSCPAAPTRRSSQPTKSVPPNGFR